VPPLPLSSVERKLTTNSFVTFPDLKLFFKSQKFELAYIRISPSHKIKIIKLLQGFMVPFSSRRVIDSCSLVSLFPFLPLFLDFLAISG